MHFDGLKTCRLKLIHSNLTLKEWLLSYHSNRRDESNLRVIIRECRNTLSSFFTNLKLKFIKRQANKVDDSLAMVTKSYASFSFFIEILGCIQNIILNKFRLFISVKKIIKNLSNLIFFLYLFINNLVQSYFGGLNYLNHSIEVFLIWSPIQF